MTDFAGIYLQSLFFVYNQLGYEVKKKFVTLRNDSSSVSACICNGTD